MSQSENEKSPQVTGTTGEENETKQIIYFYKANGENHLVSISQGNDLKSAINVKKIMERDFPKTKNNLFVAIDGVEFRL